MAAEGADATAAEGAPASAEPGEGPTVEIATPRMPGENTLRLRTRPPRRRRRPPGLRPISDAPATSESGEATVAEATPSGEEGASAAPPAPTGPRLGPDGQPLRRRRRRRRPPQLGGAGENATAAEGAAEGTATAPRDPNRPPRRRNNRRPRDDRPNDRPAAEGGEATPRDARPGRDHRAGPGRGPREGDRRREGPGGRRDRGEGRDGRGRGRGRDDREKRVERKLYNIDSVVDRGFEDVEEEGETRRVNWTIIKRTVADQITRKPMSQNYVLQRDGVDSEFPSLGAARDAVNKKIVHPEKLTLSKADHAAQKSSR